MHDARSARAAPLPPRRAAPRSGAGGAHAHALLLLALGAAGACSAPPTTPPPPAPRPPFTVAAYDDVRIDSDFDSANFQRAVTTIDVGDGPFDAVTLVVDLDTTCFPFSKWADDPPPPGESFPPSCDAFDRNFHFTLDEDDGVVPFELVRAITPFGGPLHLEVDVTDLMNGVDGGVHTLTAHITTFSDGAGLVSGSAGGWNVSAHVDVVPGADASADDVVGAAAVFFGDLTHDAPSREIEFTVPEGAATTRIEYRTTGHGGPNSDRGCIGPAEEFCRRGHLIDVADSVLIADFEPFLESCADHCTLVTGPGPSGVDFQYCEESPTGNIQSVQAPRANWCPGRVTPPFVLEGRLAPGRHTLRFEVGPNIAEGGTWLTSATALFFAD